MKVLRYIFLIVMVGSCSDPKLSDDFLYPVVIMDEVTNIDSTGLTLNARIYHEGSEEVLRSSFNWYPKGKKIFAEEERFLLDVEWKPGTPLSVRIERDLIRGIEYEAKFIIELENQKIYSSSVSFISQGAIYQPIRLKSKFAFGGTTSSVVRQGIGNVFIDINHDYNSEGIINVYNPDVDQWGLNNTIVPGGYIRSIFSSSNQYLMVADQGKLSVIESFDKPKRDITEVASGSFRTKLSFIVDNMCYGYNSDWKLTRFNILNFDGFEVLQDIPISNNALEYYTFVIGTDVYVFFSEYNLSPSSQISANQLWKYDSINDGWEQMKSFPGTGKDWFSVSTDNKQYIYVGMGAFGRDIFNWVNRKVIEGDIWRYNIMNGNWEFIGWIPSRNQSEKTYNVPFKSSNIIDDQLLLINFTVEQRHNIVSLIPEELQPF
ncbi:MAG: hypothetical protein P1U56_23900 [Saprospiraceae bacterium]|nr:hypothetical protein [Saprospiraceae bacterium]